MSMISNQSFLPNKNMDKKIRYEFKYVLNKRQADLIGEYIRKIGLRDDKAASGSYTVTSLYFDTPTLEDYRDKLSGLTRRKKLRARIYGNHFEDAAEVWLEIKEKYDMSVYKTRGPISRDEWLAFARGGVLRHDYLNNFSYLFLGQNYKPHVVVKYKRRAYVGRFLSDIRLTLDSDLETCRWRDFGRNVNMTPMQKGAVIMEVKFAEAMPWWFGDMVRRFNLSRQAFSKYANAVDALNKLNAIPR